MEVKIELIDKVYDEISEMCKLNNITVDEYIVNTVMDNYYIMKFGDLNDKFKKNTEPKKTTVKKKEEVKIEEAKPVVEPKVVPEPIPPTPTVKEEEVPKTNIDVNLQNKIKHTRRTLKTK